MRAKFTRAEGYRLGIRFEPESFEEQLLLEQFTREAAEMGHHFEFSGWEHNNRSSAMREGLTSCWGQLVKKSKCQYCEKPVANGFNTCSSCADQNGP